MTTLREIVDAIRRDVISPRHAPAYEDARARRPAFADHESIESILVAMGDEKRSTYPVREALSQAILAESSGSALWCSVLTVAYYPLLSHLRRRIIASDALRADLDQLVVESFVSAAFELLPHERTDRTALRLRQRTERKAFRSLGRNRIEEVMTETFEELKETAQRAHHVGEGQGQVDAERERARFILRAVKDGRVAPVCGEVLVATVIGHEMLRDYVGRVFQGDEVTRARTYQRLKRQRTRALRRLRAFAASAPTKRS